MGRRVYQVVVASLAAGAFVFVSTAGLRCAGGQVRHVPGDYLTIQSAVSAAQAGDTILVAAGVYSENVVVSTSGVRLLGGATSCAGRCGDGNAHACLVHQLEHCPQGGWR